MQEGLAYRITPFNTTETNARIDSEKMYDNLMHKFKFGGIDKKGIYLDETVLRMCDTHRRMFVQLSTQLIKEGKKEQALKALNYCEQVIPASNVPHDYIMSSSKEMAMNFATLGEYKKAEDILNQMANNAVEYLTWYLSLDDTRLASSYENCMRYFYILDDVCKSLSELKPQSGEQQNETFDAASHYTKKFNELYDMLGARTGQEK